MHIVNQFSVDICMKKIGKICWIFLSIWKEDETCASFRFLPDLTLPEDQELQGFLPLVNVLRYIFYIML